MLTLIACVAALGAAQPQDTPAALGGPTVPDAGTPSLVERDFSGRVRRLDAPPEEAALNLLDLDAATRERVWGVLAERARMLEDLVCDNVDLLGQLNTASQTGDKLDQLVLGLRLLGRLDPLREAGPLHARIARLLPAENAAQFERLVREYWRELIAEQDKPEPAGVIIGESLRVFGEEVGRAFQRSVESGALIARVALADVKLSPEQRKRIDRIIFEFRARAGEGDAEKRYAQLAIAVLAHLTPDQQARALERLKGL